ncbi:MAG: hypothetical protein JWN21_2164 [Sphingomonas bacterium]|uniref:hypothetical protein n=1 Tax=Sphingomonas bacterium TaxID=1895847 RepID=UPI0026369082|nr:hypothetical protein [Sphingomonas bacterium]MDB5696621.1 hypothetical protein [Sphingomonas bacterium]
MGSSAWQILTIVGPIVLIVAIAWAALHNRQSRGGVERTEHATHDLYQEQDRADKAGETKQDDGQPKT